jgi:hypothetical protein
MPGGHLNSQDVDIQSPKSQQWEGFSIGTVPDAHPAARSQPGEQAGAKPDGTESAHSQTALILQQLQELKDQQAEAAAGGGRNVDPHDVQDVENMLEAYTLQADYLLAQLSELNEELDDFQARLPRCRSCDTRFLVNSCAALTPAAAVRAGVLPQLQGA